MKSDRIFLLELLKLILILHLHLYWRAFLLEYFSKIILDLPVDSMHIDNALSRLRPHHYAFTIWSETCGWVTKGLWYILTSSWWLDGTHHHVLINRLRFPHNQILRATHRHFLGRLLSHATCKTAIHTTFIYVWTPLQQTLHLFFNLKFLIRVVWTTWSSSIARWACPYGILSFKIWLMRPVYLVLKRYFIQVVGIKFLLYRVVSVCGLHIILYQRTFLLLRFFGVFWFSSCCCIYWRKSALIESGLHNILNFWYRNGRFQIFVEIQFYIQLYSGVRDNIILLGTEFHFND